MGVSFDGNNVYVAVASQGMVQLDVSNPSNPILADGEDTAGFSRQLIVRDKWAFVADGYGGLIILEKRSGLQGRLPRGPRLSVPGPILPCLHSKRSNSLKAKLLLEI